MKINNLGILSIWLLCNYGGSKVAGEQYQLGSEEEVNRTEASSICASLGDGWGLPEDRTTEDHQRLAAEMEKRGWQTMWLSHVKTELKEWTWVNSNRTESLRENPGERCAFYDTYDKVLKAGKCTEGKKRGHICQMRDLQCPPGRLNNCVVNRGKAYILACDLLDWFAARWFCSEAGGTLASRKPEGISLDYKSPCDDPWIGLHREDWIYKEKSDDYVKRNYWMHSKGYKHDQNGDSSVMIIEGHKIGWKAVNRSVHYHVLCQQYGSKASSTATNSHTGGTTHSKELAGSGIKTALILLAVILALVTVGFLCLAVSYIHLRRKVKTRKRPSSDSVTPTRYWPTQNQNPVDLKYQQEGNGLYSVADCTLDREQKKKNDREVAAELTEVKRNPPEGATVDGSATRKDSTEPNTTIDLSVAHLYAVPDVNRKSMRGKSLKRESESVDIVDNIIYDQ